MDKLIWTLTGEAGADVADFQRFVIEEVAPGAGARVPSCTDVRVTLQTPGEYTGAFVEIGDAERAVDAALEVITDESYVPLDEVHEHLRTSCAHVQGWRVRPNVIYDASAPVGMGEPSAFPNIFCFVERIDGSTPEHFDRNWSIHAGHLDGQEAESEESRAERQREEEAAPGQLYRQNRVLEPVTPTAWVVHGYTQLRFGFLLPGVGDEPYERVRGEEEFDRWPPRILQGHEYRVA
jgi:hypothetical protein